MTSYVIKLRPEESIGIYGFLNAKKTLSWKDITIHKHIKLKSCIDNGISTQKLYKLQPDLKEWIKLEKTCIEDFPHLIEWGANPFEHFNCNIGDLIVHRKYIDGKSLKNCGIQFRDLLEKFGLSNELMVLLRYSCEDWIQLGITKDYTDKISQDHWTQIFGELSRADVQNFIERHSKSTEQLLRK
jgi:hypothetical protein